VSEHFVLIMVWKDHAAIAVPCSPTFRLLNGEMLKQFIAVSMLYQGQGADTDKKNGFNWLLKATEQGKMPPGPV